MPPATRRLRERLLTWKFLRATALVARAIAAASERIVERRPELESVVERRLDNTSARIALQSRCFRARLARLSPHKRGAFSPQEAFDILQYGAACRLTHAQLAEEFLITEQTVREWHKTLLTDQPARKPATPIRGHDHALALLSNQLAGRGVEVGEISRAFLRAALDVPVENIRRWTRSARLKPPTRPQGYSPVPAARRRNHVWNIDISMLRRKWRIGFAHLTVLYDAFSRNPVAACLTHSSRAPRSSRA